MGWSTVNLDEEKQQQDVRRARSWAGGRCRSLVGWALGWGLSSALPTVGPPCLRALGSSCVNGVYRPGGVLWVK